MQIVDYPKVLILGHQFDNQTGLGITLANLFAGWPRDRVAILAHLIDVNKCEVSRPCCKYIGPRYTPSKHAPKTGLKGRIRRRIRDFYYYLGINERNYKFSYNEIEIHEAQTFNPNIIFCCLGSLNSMKDCLQVKQNFPEARLVLYIVDDWVNTKENNRLFSSYWRKQNDRYFRILLDKADGLLSICPQMSEAYYEKYKKTFIPFHNPADVGYWKSLSKESKYGEETKAIVYVGKINVDTKQTLLDVASAIQVINARKDKKFTYRLDVYTPNNVVFGSLFNDLDYCQVLPPVPHDDIPSLMKGYDALLLTLGFSQKTRDYVRLSMPTKVSEYLASEVPIILYCPKDIALSRYLKSYDCSINCFERRPALLIDSLLLLEDSVYCKKIKENSIKLANKHDSIIVRKSFEEMMFKLI